MCFLDAIEAAGNAPETSASAASESKEEAGILSSTYATAPIPDRDKTKLIHVIPTGAGYTSAKRQKLSAA